MKLYGYFRSSAAYRVRIVLNLKGIEYQQVAVHLVEGTQHSEAYANLNPQGLVPTLVLDDGRALTQSLAICEYLEETYPNPPVLPDDAAGRARVRALAHLVACEIHPLNNLRVLKYLTGAMGVDETNKLDWYRHWVNVGLAGLESHLAGSSETGSFCHGEFPTLADICLVPQLFNARRFECDLEPFPTVRKIGENCEALPDFAAAHPAQQPDAQ